MSRMHRATLYLLIAVLCLTSVAAGSRQETPQPGAPTVDQIAILSPSGGQVLQGLVELVIQTNVPGLLHTELAFTYQGDPTGTWFLLYESNQPSERATVEWDTGAITDGNYTLLLTAALENGGFQSMRIENLRVRNYSPVETNTPPAAPTQPAPSATPQPESLPPAATAAATPTSTPEPTATAAPQAAPALPTPRPNPAAIAPEQVSGSILRGSIAALGVFALAGVYWSIKRLGKRR